jgi:DUF1680 family protein
MAAKEKIFDVSITSSIHLRPVTMKISDANIVALQGEAKVLRNNSWKNILYKEVNTTMKPITIKLIPYYAWANRGASDMTVWMPLMR